jgi:hypothetical protein
MVLCGKDKARKEKSDKTRIQEEPKAIQRKERDSSNIEEEVNGKNEDKEAKTEKRRGKDGGESGASENRAIRTGNWNGKAKDQKESGRGAKRRSCRTV